MSRSPRWVWLFAALFVVITSLPYAVGVLNAPPSGAFTGNAFEQTRVDYNSHLAKMQIGQRGEWLYHILFTPEDHPGALIQTFYVGLGHVARLLSLPLSIVYHAARLLSTLAMVLVIWRFVERFTPAGASPGLALLLATITGGLGWVLYFLAPAQTATLAPIEFWLFDAYTFFAALTFPHFAAAVALLLAFFLTLRDWLAAPSWRGAGWLSLWALLLGWVQPFDLLLTALIAALLGGWALLMRRIAWRALFMLIPVAVVHGFVVGYHFAALGSHPVWTAFTAQNITLSPPPVYLLLGYAWLFVPAIIGGIHAWWAREGSLLLPVLWILVTIPLIYAPLQTQRRFLMGVQVPLAVLAAVGLSQLAHRWRPGRWRLLLTGGLLLSTISHALFLLSALGTLTPSARPELFLSRDEVAALAWLHDQPSDVVILGAFPSGGQVTAFTGRRVYLGHWIETMDFDEREAQVAAFFAPDGLTDFERRALLDTAGIDFVWWDDAARALGGWSPAAVPYLALAFESESVIVFEVLP